MSQPAAGRAPAVAAWESHDTEGRRCVLDLLREEANEADRCGSTVFAPAARLAIRVLQRPETITEKDLSQVGHAAASDGVSNAVQVTRDANAGMTSRRTKTMRAIRKQVPFFGQQVVIACDGRCDKAWGIHGRPRVLLSDETDDYVFAPDDALGIAGPPDSKEGGDARPSSVPLTDGEHMNRWCARECERGEIYKLTEDIALRDLGNPRTNIPGRPSPFVRDEAGRVCLSVAKDVEIWNGRERVTMRVEPGAPLAEAFALVGDSGAVDFS